MLVAGLSMLLGVLLERLGLPATERFGESTGERLTLATALVATALPVWGIHWFVAERSVRPDQTHAAVERTSSVRGLYFAVALAVLLGVAASGIGTVIMSGFRGWPASARPLTPASPKPLPRPSLPASHGSTTCGCAVVIGRADR